MDAKCESLITSVTLGNNTCDSSVVSGAVAAVKFVCTSSLSLNEVQISGSGPPTGTVAAPTGTQIVIKQRINFTTGKAAILSDSFPVLDDVTQVLKDYPNIQVEIGGHTDNVGEDATNQRLSKSRADAVFEYLLSHGVRANRMVTVGYGETRPIYTNMTDAGKLANRRVEFMITDTSVKPAPVAPQPEPASPW